MGDDIAPSVGHRRRLVGASPNTQPPFKQKPSTSKAFRAKCCHKARQ